MTVLAAPQAAATCPTATDNGVTYDFAYPKVGASGATGTLVVMSDGDAAVDIDDPCGGTTCYPTATTPCVYTMCDAAQFRGTGPTGGYHISLGRVDAAVATLHVVFKTEGSTDAEEDAFLVIPSDPVRRGNSYLTLGQRGAGCSGCSQESNWIVTALASLTLSYRNCSDATSSSSLASGEVFQQSCASSATRPDDTGNAVTSGSGGPNFGLISGSTCAFVPANTGYCEPLLEMIPPTGWLGTEYFVTDFNKGSGATVGDLVRIVATAGSTTVSFTAVSGGSIAVENSSGHACGGTSSHSFTAAGQWCDILVEGGARLLVTSGSAVLVGQYMKGYTATGVGDAAMSLVLPTSRYRCGGPFFSFLGFDQDSLGNGSYVNIVAPSSALATVELDGEDLSVGVKCGGYSKVDFGTSGYSWTKCLLADPVSPGTQHILDSGTTPIAAYVYGQNDVRGAYAYPSGMGF